MPKLTNIKIIIPKIMIDEIQKRNIFIRPGFSIFFHGINVYVTNVESIKKSKKLVKSINNS